MSVKTGFFGWDTDLVTRTTYSCSGTVSVSKSYTAKIGGNDDHGTYHADLYSVSYSLTFECSVSFSCDRLSVLEYPTLTGADGFFACVGLTGVSAPASHFFSLYPLLTGAASKVNPNATLGSFSETYATSYDYTPPTNRSGNITGVITGFMQVSAGNSDDDSENCINSLLATMAWVPDATTPGNMEFAPIQAAALPGSYIFYAGWNSDPLVNMYNLGGVPGHNFSEDYSSGGVTFTGTFDIT